MKIIKLLTLLIAVYITMPTMAFSTNEERIDSYLELLAKSGTNTQKIEMVQGLKWSGLSDPRLYDQIEKYLLDYTKLTSTQLSQKNDLMKHMIRALGFSGNEKYRPTLEFFNGNAAKGRFHRYAKTALAEMRRFGLWNNLIAESTVNVEGKSIEVATYMKMLSTDDVFVQRLAARAMFAENRNDPDLLALAAEKLEGVYLDKYMGRQGLDSAAWLCKAIGHNGGTEYKEFLRKIATNTPNEKIKRHALKYVN